MPTLPVLAVPLGNGARLSPGTIDPALATTAFTITLDAEEVGAWLRTLAALRLALASRLGIVTEDDHDPDDPRFGVYEWVGHRLDGLVRAIGR